MIPNINIKAVIYVIAIVLFLVFIGYVYNKGKSVAEKECEEKQLELELEWKNKVSELNTQNEKAFIAYKNKANEFEAFRKAKRRDIINYVQEDPSSDAIILSDDLVRKLNEN